MIAQKRGNKTRFIVRRKNPHHTTSIATWLEAISGWMTREACVQIGIHIA